MALKLIFYDCPYKKIEKDIIGGVPPYQKDCFCKTSEGLFKGIPGLKCMPNTPRCIGVIEDIREYNKSLSGLRLEDKFYLWELKLSLKPNEIILVRDNGEEINVTSSIR